MLPAPRWATALACSLGDEVDMGATAMALGAKRIMDAVGLAVGEGNQLAIRLLEDHFLAVFGRLYAAWESQDVPRRAMEAAGLRL